MGREGENGGELESNNQVALRREGMGDFAVGGEVVVAPENIGSRGGIRGVGDDAAHWTARFRGVFHGRA